MNWLPLQVLARPMTAILVGISILVLLRGHNEPGGGFIGGLIAAAGLSVYALSFGVRSARRLLQVRADILAMLGLIVAGGSGLPGLASGTPYMTPHWWAQLAKVSKLGTPLLFDIGVYLVVVGACVLVVFRLLEAAGPAEPITPRAPEDAETPQEESR